MIKKADRLIAEAINIVADLYKDGNLEETSDIILMPIPTFYTFIKPEVLTSNRCYSRCT